MALIVLSALLIRPYHHHAILQSIFARSYQFHVIRTMTIVGVVPCGPHCVPAVSVSKLTSGYETVIFTLAIQVTT